MSFSNVKHKFLKHLHVFFFQLISVSECNLQSFPQKYFIKYIRKYILKTEEVSLNLHFWGKFDDLHAYASNIVSTV